MKLSLRKGFVIHGIILIKMLNLDPDEKIQLVMHHHWIFIVGEAVLTFFLASLPFIAGPFFLLFVNITATPSLFIFFSSIWLLIVALIGFGLWMDYYLDALVITDRRILNVEQTGIFKHSVQEFRIEKVQDVTIEAPNFLATFLNYGNITLSTAGEMTFSIKEVPNPHLARDVILKNAKNIGGKPQSL